MIENEIQFPEKEFYTRANGTRGVRTVHKGETLTQQQFKEDCDVNIIMAKFLKTGHINHLRLRDAGVYADLVGAPDFQEAMQTITQAQHAFDELPAETRLRFGNDPNQMVKFLANPDNQEEAIKLGMMVRRPEQPKNEALETLKEINSNLKPKKKSSED
ncbi:MAG: hypothetical protein AB7T49_21660 [Oligoflexales bacterium]